MSDMIDVRVASNGRLVLPKAIREALGLTEAGTVLMSVVDDEVRLTTVAKSIEEAQALYRKHVKRSMTTDEFLLQRREEALKERRFDGSD